MQGRYFSGGGWRRQHDALDDEKTLPDCPKTLLDGLETLLDGLETLLDGLETLLDGLETLLDGLETLLDGLETLLDLSEADLERPQAVVESIEAEAHGAHLRQQQAGRYGPVPTMAVMMATPVPTIHLVSLFIVLHLSQTRAPRPGTGRWRLDEAHRPRYTGELRYRP